ncbi:hypothetical protein HYALB_00007747 [Hymenoscyphus albidus]|uniref:Ubiquitin 3 binding protein But2 C-terminal domain-containing protein n=1 Tax=Hymenoscyphus albidus TaxID=595503 RepID=A0A9N9Q833_9HELO|nr:hypothetical protein HYALB_00007747 [Hymenoscyphus albidus]
MVSSTTVLLGFVSGSLAALLPRQATQCTFYANAVGLEGNPNVRQDTIGQPKIGGTFPLAKYIIDNNSLKDTQGHTCIISPEDSQLQCTTGVPQNTVFTFSNDFHILHNYNSKWLACPSSGPGSDGSQLIFSDAKPDKTGCSEIELLAGGFGCAALGRPETTTSPKSARSTPAPYQKVENTSAICPTDISSGTFQFPHLIIPTSLTNPDQIFGTSYTAYISASNTTLYTFDIPATAPYLGTCSLIFQFPYGSELDPSVPKFYFSGLEQQELGGGGLNFALLEGAVTNETSASVTPGVKTDFGTRKMVPGTNMTVGTFPCKNLNGRGTVKVSSVGEVELDYFQDSRRQAIGLYVVPCA